LWDKPDASSVDGDLPEKYVVYAFANKSEAITNMNDGSKILDIVAGNELSITQSMMDTKYFVVTSLDKNNNEAGDFNNTLSNSKFELPNQAFKVYPNQFVDSFQIEFVTNIPEKANISIYDNSGKEVWVQNINTSNNSIITIKPSNLSKGIYFGKISFDDGTNESFKLIKY
jgi:hypothetical protein